MVEKNKLKLYNPLQFINAHFGMKIKIHMRRDSQSKHIPQTIEGELVAYDMKSGIVIVNTEDKHVIVDNRGSRSHIEIPRGK